MKYFSIKELEVLSGIRQHTIRVWEKRYTVFKPKRSGGNVRRYSVEELSKLLNLSLLLDNKFKISRLAAMKDDELLQSVGQLKEEKARICRFIYGLAVEMYKMDIDAFEALLDECFLTFPVEKVVQDVLFPFLEKVNLLCRGKRQNEEHLVVTCIRRKLLWSIENSTSPVSSGKTILLFLSGENQLDLLLLYFYYHLKTTGWKVIYMGVDISRQNLEEMLPAKKPHYLLTYLPTKNPLLLNALSEIASRLADGAAILIVCPDEIKETKEEYDNIRRLRYKEALQLLKQIA